VGAPAPGAKTPSRMQKGAGPVRTEAVLLHVRNHYVPGAYGAALVRYTPYCGRAGARPPRAPPRRRSTRPGCENVLAPFAPRRCSYTYEAAGNVEHQLDERIRPDHEAPACTRALPHRQKKSPGCEQPGDCLEHGSISCGSSPGGSG